MTTDTKQGLQSFGLGAGFLVVFFWLIIALGALGNAFGDCFLVIPDTTTNGVYKVKATGDSTQDRTNLQAAITAACAVHGRVRVCPGIYKLSALGLSSGAPLLSITATIDFVGESRNGVRLLVCHDVDSTHDIIQIAPAERIEGAHIGNFSWGSATRSDSVGRHGIYINMMGSTEGADAFASSVISDIGCTIDSIPFLWGNDIYSNIASTVTDGIYCNVFQNIYSCNGMTFYKLGDSNIWRNIRVTNYLSLATGNMINRHQNGMWLLSAVSGAGMQIIDGFFGVGNGPLLFVNGQAFPNISHMNVEEWHPNPGTVGNGYNACLLVQNCVSGSLRDATVTAQSTATGCYAVHVVNTTRFIIDGNRMNEIGSASYALQVDTTCQYTTLSNNQYNQGDVSNYWTLRHVQDAYASYIGYEPAPVPGAPTSPTVSAIGTTTAYLSWTAMPNASSYNVTVSANSNYSSPIFAQTAYTGISEFISGLTTGTLYYWRVAAVSGMGASAWATGMFTTN